MNMGAVVSMSYLHDQHLLEACFVTKSNRG